MVRFKNLNYDWFLKEAQDKRIICYGAGGTLRDFLRNNRAKFNVIKRVDFILDSNADKSGLKVNTGQKELSLLTPVELIASGVDIKKYIIILCVANKSVTSVLEILDKLPEFDEITVVYGIAALFYSREVYPLPLSQRVVLPKINGKYEIPKIIHYCWFGHNPLGEIERKCIESWKRLCPTYEIKLWSEDNYDISNKPLYVRQAYESGKYAFVSDYARLDIVNQYGGVYLDTDVLLLRSLDKFLLYKAFYVFMPYNDLSTGLGFGSIANNIDLQTQLEWYENTQFQIEEEISMPPCPVDYCTDYYNQKGLLLTNVVQQIEDTLFLTSDYMCSLMPVLCENGLYHLPLYALTANSHAVHCCASTWMESDMHSTFYKVQMYYKDINTRILADWKREYLGVCDNE